MIDILIPGFDIALTAASGQCFRFDRIGNMRFRVIASGRRLEIEDLGAHRFRPDCDEQIWRSFWHDYFDMDRDYAAVMAAIPEDDIFLREAAAFAGGLRILRQDPWEILITFIISQRKSIPAIASAVEKLCQRAGEEIKTPLEILYTFPTPQKLSSLSPEDLKACSLGYRIPYIAKSAEIIKKSPHLLKDMATYDDEQLLNALMELNFGS